MTLRGMISELREYVDVDEGLGQHVKSAFHKIKAKLTGKKIAVGHSRKKFRPSPTAAIRKSMARSRELARA